MARTWGRKVMAFWRTRWRRGALGGGASFRYTTVSARYLLGNAITVPVTVPRSASKGPETSSGRSTAGAFSGGLLEGESAGEGDVVELEAGARALGKTTNGSPAAGRCTAGRLQERRDDELEVRIGEEHDPRHDPRVRHPRTSAAPSATCLVRPQLRQLESDGGHDPGRDDVGELVVVRERPGGRAIALRVQVPLDVQSGVELEGTPLRPDRSADHVGGVLEQDLRITIGRPGEAHARAGMVGEGVERDRRLLPRTLPVRPAVSLAVEPHSSELHAHVPVHIL